MAKLTKADVEGIRVRIGDRTLTPREVLDRVAKEPDQAAKQVSGPGATVVASAAVIEQLQTIFGAEHVGDDGTIASALTGLEEALIIIAVVGTLSGAGVGYLLGFEAGQAADESANGGGGGESEGGDDDGDDGGDGEGGEGGDGGDGESNGGSDRE